MYNPNLAFLRAYPSGRVVRRFIGEDGRALHIQEEGWFDEKTLVLRLVWRLFDSASDKEMDIHSLIMSIRQFLPEDIRKSVEEAGLQISEYFSGLSREPFTSAARHQVLVCTAGGLNR